MFRFLIDKNVLFKNIDLEFREVQVKFTSPNCGRKLVHKIYSNPSNGPNINTSGASGPGLGKHPEFHSSREKVNPSLQIRRFATGLFL